MALHTVVPVYSAVWQKRRVSEVAVRLLHDGVADYHSCVEHLEVAVWERGSVTIAIRAVDREVVGTTPHAPRAELHVEALFALID